MSSDYHFIIIDDEEQSRSELLQAILPLDFPLKLVGIASDVNEGLELIQEKKPDLVFLDVQMPPLTGFDLLKQLNNFNFSVIFVTSFDQFAIQAIRFNAIDYLLKPVQVDELNASISRFLEQTTAKKNSAERIENLIKNNTEIKQNHKIVIPFADGFSLARTAEIIRCQADRNYTFIYTLQGKIHSSKTLKEYENLLADYGFLRIHQSHLVGIQHVKNYYKGKEHEIELDDGSRLPVAKSKRKEVLEKLNRQI